MLAQDVDNVEDEAERARRMRWIDYYVGEGRLEDARELGWKGTVEASANGRLKKSPGQKAKDSTKEPVNMEGAVNMGVFDQGGRAEASVTQRDNAGDSARGQVPNRAGAVAGGNGGNGGNVASPGRKVLSL